MGILANHLSFESSGPTLTAIQEAMTGRTGLTCRVTEQASGTIEVGCSEFLTDIEMRFRQLDGKLLVDLEQPIGQTVYLFGALQESLVDLGGRTCDFRGRPRSEASRFQVVRWSDRKWTERFLDKHPAMTGLIWLAVMVPKGLLDLARRQRRPGR